MNILFLIAGLALIILGAQFLVDGSSAVAKRLKMPEFLIGLTVVGKGTSMPELVVSLFGTLDGKGDLAIGNVVGSNIANVMLILGVTAIIRPIPVHKSVVKFDIPFNIIVTVILMLFCFGGDLFGNTTGTISRTEGIFFLVLFAMFLFRSFRMVDRNPSDFTSENQPVSTKKMPPAWLSIVMIIGGIAGLIFGGRLFVSSGVEIARLLGVSETVIAITLMALGTSLPELATSVVAAAKGKTDLALGNIIGSNISNICLILGVCATISPLDTAGVQRFDLYAVLFSCLLLYTAVFTFRRNSVDRWDGIVFLTLYVAYIFMLTSR